MEAMKVSKDIKQSLMSFTSLIRKLQTDVDYNEEMSNLLTEIKGYFETSEKEAV